MMEFTCNGLVRNGFGFYNPNHAAALICALLPLLWGAWQRWPRPAIRVAVVAAALLGLTGLALTFSRTGALVLLLEGAWLLGRAKRWKLLVAGGGIFLLLLAACGVLMRFTPDAAVLNRPRIWSAGAALVAANPWHGVGFGNSGALASAFLLDGIECRTLVNSHLTLLAEWGAPAGVIWGTFLFYALWNGRNRPVLQTAFAGLTLSAFSASIFDWHTLFDFRNFGGLPLLNFMLSWSLLLLYLGMGIGLCRGKSRPRALGICMIAALMFVLTTFCFRNPEAPHVRSGSLEATQPDAPTVCYDATWSWKRLRRFFNRQFTASLRPLTAPQTGSSGTIWLFGDAVELAGKFPEAQLILISPPAYVPLPENTLKIYRKRFAEPADPRYPTEWY